MSARAGGCAHERHESERATRRVKAGRGGAAAAAVLLRGATWPPGRTATGPWAALVAGAEAAPAGPLSACSGRAGGSGA